MSVTPFKASLGPSRVSGNSSQANFARSVQAQMQQIVQNFKDWAKHMDGISIDVLYEALQPTFDKSQELVPYQTGRLHDSGYLEKTTFRGGARVEIGYAKGGDPDYAVFVHERTDISHRAPTQAKFLQQPLEEDWPRIQEEVVNSFKEASGT